MNDILKEIWQDYETDEFEFNGKEAIIVFADKSVRTNKWALKTEYMGAFPEIEYEFLKNGYNIAYLPNNTRWGSEEDYKNKYEFSKILTEKYGFCEKCAIIGLSCGGLHGIHTAARYPEMVAVMYIDAPVVNLLSCPSHKGWHKDNDKVQDSWYKEFFSHTGITHSELISQPIHPINKVPELVKNNIPIIMAAGDSDVTVPYIENGALLEKYYKEIGGTIEVIIKEGCDHHPHGLEDNSIIVDFIKKYY